MAMLQELSSQRSPEHSPVQPEGVQEGREALHQHQDGDGEERPRHEDAVQDHAAHAAVAHAQA